MKKRSANTINVYIREGLMPDEELQALNSVIEEIEVVGHPSDSTIEVHLDSMTRLATLGQPGPLLCRYSALPYYAEVVSEFAAIKMIPVNSYKQHRLVASMEWVHLCQDITPKTWLNFADWVKERGNESDRFWPVILKGRTNSKKWHWFTDMFAQTRADVNRIYCKLLDDTFIGPQGIVVREFENFKQLIGLDGNLLFGINGIPLINEWRLFFFKGRLIGKYEYWSSILDDMDQPLDFDDEGLLEFTQHDQFQSVLNEVPFCVVDVGKRHDNEWRIIEVNDGQMSGIPTDNIDSLKQFYFSLFSEISANRGDYAI